MTVRRRTPGPWAIALGVMLSAGTAHAAEAQRKPAAPQPPPAAAAKPKAPPPAPAPQEPPEMAAGRKLYNARCGRCHEAYNPGVQEMTWNRWIWKWKDKARLTDDEYDQLMVFARRVREANQAKVAR